jgi:hypothetical protein
MSDEHEKLPTCNDAREAIKYYDTVLPYIVEIRIISISGEIFDNEIVAVTKVRECSSAGR